MKQNMGKTDRLVRLVMAIALALLWFQQIVTGIAGIVLLVLAFVFIVTSVVGNCPLYSIFGINTCGRKKAA